MFDVSKRTAHVCLIRVVKALHQLNRERGIISWPRGQEAVDIIGGFETMYGFPGVLGAIDGTHIEIPAPKDNPNSYCNRKKFHSVILQCVCDNELMFTDCYAGEVGSVHDACVYRRSDLQQIVSQEDSFPFNSHLIGDAAYPLNHRLLTPFRDNGHLESREKNYNKRLSSARSTIERAFALLKCRFRRLKMLDMRLISFIPAVIVAACILHNICLMQNDRIIDYSAEFNAVATDLDATPVSGNTEHHSGVSKRQQIANMLMQAT